MTPGWLDTARARWAPASDVPLLVRAHLAGPLAWDGYNGVTLEGALQWVVVCRESGMSPPDALVGSPHVDIQIPIVDITMAGKRVACASWARLPVGYLEDTRLRRKRTRVEALGLRQVMTNGGPHKAMQIPVACIVAPYVEFAVRGDRDKIVDLLRDMAGLGRDRGRGLGIVEGWEVVPDPQDGSLVIDGAPQRALPVEDGDLSPYREGTYELRDGQGCRAPYWHPSTRTLCVVPSC